MRRFAAVTLLAAVAVAQGGGAVSRFGLAPGQPLPRLEHVPQVAGTRCAHCLIRDM